jgi:uncharacterized protein
MTGEMQLPITVEEARSLYDHVADTTHRFDHVLRVYKLAETIGLAEGADARVLLTACLLHDVSRGAEDAGEVSDHAEDGARQARHLLQKEPVGFADAVADAIASHRFRASNPAPATLEAQILFDADKLDAIGAVGIARAFTYGGTNGQPLWTSADSERHSPAKEFAVKLKKLQGMLFTPTARSIAVERHAFMVGFFERLRAEIQGDL